MSDISFYGIVALLLSVVLGLISIAAFSILAVLVVGFKKRRLRGFMWSCLGSGVLCLLFGLWIESGRNDTQLLMQADRYAPFAGVAVVVGIIAIGFMSWRRSKVISP